MNIKGCFRSALLPLCNLLKSAARPASVLAGAIVISGCASAPAPVVSNHGDGAVAHCETSKLSQKLVGVAANENLLSEGVTLEILTQGMTEDDRSSFVHDDLTLSIFSVKYQQVIAKATSLDGLCYVAGLPFVRRIQQPSAGGPR